MAFFEGEPEPMNSLIQAAEIWLPDSESTLLEFGAGLYDKAVDFGVISRSMCFGRAEGLPGRAWDEAHPILLTDLQGGYFRRAAAAKKAGLTCAAAIPMYLADTLKAVLVLFCGGEQREEGAVELWRNDPRVATDMTLVEGYYGASANAMLADARETWLPRGIGLPGMAWQREASVFIDGVPRSPKFLRSESAAAAGIRHGLALPCAVPGNRHYVLALLGTRNAPIARRVESWVPAAGGAMQRSYGHCEQKGLLQAGEKVAMVGEGDNTIALAFASAVPQIRAHAAQEPGAVGASAVAAGLGGFVALPISAEGVVSEVVALYF